MAAKCTTILMAKIVLKLSKEEMLNILEGTGWKIEKFINSGSSAYVAIIGKEGLFEKLNHRPDSM